MRGPARLGLRGIDQLKAPRTAVKNYTPTSKVQMGQRRSPSPTSSDAVVVSVAPSIENIKVPAADTQSRKKNKRPSKRFLWQEDLRFVAAIFDR
ncbi:hypothetical protein GQ600_17982 [Phytophthora cactorum]|nr:hypothetical protein GQ600_17982 [Phytophthora cactorum]